MFYLVEKFIRENNFVMSFSDQNLNRNFLCMRLYVTKINFKNFFLIIF